MNPPKEVGLIRKFVPTTRSITTKQVELSLGILRVMKNPTWLEYHNIRPLTSEELTTIEAYYDRIKELPLGPERTQWSPELLSKADAKPGRITAKYQEKRMSVFSRIVPEAA